MIEKSRVRVPAGAAGELSSPGSASPNTPARDQTWDLPIMILDALPLSYLYPHSIVYQCIHSCCSIEVSLTNADQLVRTATAIQGRMGVGRGKGGGGGGGIFMGGKVLGSRCKFMLAVNEACC